MTNLTSTQLKELVQAHEVHWNLQVLIQKAQEITNLATSIQKSLQTFETGQEINQDKLLKDLERLRIIKYHLRGIRFIYFYQSLKGETPKYPTTFKFDAEIWMETQERRRKEREERKK